MGLFTHLAESGGASSELFTLSEWDTSSFSIAQALSFFKRIHPGFPFSGRLTRIAARRNGFVRPRLPPQSQIPRPDWLRMAIALGFAAIVLGVARLLP
ncbi:MAG: hypothetical protein CXZ00_05930 [Acidobacteria bacterium]|nr:MAG: hypothetical protein CXZ00_05930 [Acidobacteriota bacterium]